ncbi:cell envelope-related function transcriptional attenuator common domain-containing protein [Friedmanniella luteola]|uniref:Cell envelope-related function transcriptional attenuator common domain-containing protein n=1 Tax=Friedmanniella luteola TaxID=546871 RepID=A0A1H1YI86_9ACTN|nr:LCP family protein [Friedmanniella luteola]SDT21035.1 cell envelope-related function transcriptional attenuator common domain-containing protein [Friedmanniella luteola]
MSISTAEDHLPTTLHTPQQRSERVKLRRGLTFLGMTLVLPGSAQIAAGNRAVGRIALRVWIGLWVLLALVALLALVWRNGAIALVTSGVTLRLVQVALVVLGLGWGLLLVDAWRISRPPELARRHRLGFAVLNLALVFTVVGGLLASASIVSSQRDLMASVFAGGGDQEVKHGRYNVLMLGGDAGADRVGLRPDSMTVASVDAETGRTVLISLPRNLEDVPFPESSPLHAEFPHGYTCADHSCMLNAVYTYATEHPELYPGVRNPGAQATVEAIEGATGLQINYWALIDLKGFEDLVDAVGGITMDVYRRVPIGGGSTKIHGYVEAGKDRHLTGREALWFARSRADSSDYDRMVRQKCVMNAMLDQMDPATVLTNFNKIAAAGQEVVATSVPTTEVGTMMDLALKAKKLPTSSLAVVPPLIQPGAPDFDVLRGAVADKIAASEAKDAPKPVATATASSPAPSSASTAPKKKKPAASKGADTDDLTAVCSA